jgi:hypothetical protein
MRNRHEMMPATAANGENAGLGANILGWPAWPNAQLRVSCLTELILGACKVIGLPGNAADKESSSHGEDNLRHP